MPIKIAKTVRFPEVRIGTAGRPTTFGRNLNYLRRLKVGFSEHFAQALKNPRHTLSRFFSEFDLETISREGGIAGIKTSHWLEGLSRVFDEYCQEYDLTRTMRVPGGHQEMAEYKIIHEELDPAVRGRRFVLDYEEPRTGDMLELVQSPPLLPPALTAEKISERLTRAEELFLDRHFAEAQLEIGAVLDDMREGDFEPLFRLKILQVASVIYIGVEKQNEALEVFEEMFSLFSEAGIDRFSLPRFFDFMIVALWQMGNRPLAYKVINLSTDIAGEMLIILEMGDPGSTLMGKFYPVSEQLRAIRNHLEGEANEEAARITSRIARLLERAEAVNKKYLSIEIGPKQKKLPN